MDFFTVATLNYGDKVDILSSSIKKYHPSSRFFWVILETKQVVENLIFKKNLNNITKIITIESFKNFDEAWIFEHNVVEACTGIKASAFKFIFQNEVNVTKLVYLDPDTAIYSKLTELEESNANILLTPHILKKENTSEGIEDNELSVLKHGLYNLGFLYVRNSIASFEFLDWWEERLINYCFDDISQGMFTDQKWIDLAPLLFHAVKILRHDGYNVSTWNLTNRKISKKDNLYYVNEVELRFFHFSGYDSNAHQGMLKKYSVENDREVLGEISQDYSRNLGLSSYRKFKKTEWSFSKVNGVLIDPQLRRLFRLYRQRGNPKINPYSVELEYLKDLLGNLEKKSTEFKLQDIYDAFESREINISKLIIDNVLTVNEIIDKFTDKENILIIMNHGLGGGIDNYIKKEKIDLCNLRKTLIEINPISSSGDLYNMNIQNGGLSIDFSINSRIFLEFLENIIKIKTTSILIHSLMNFTREILDYIYSSKEVNKIFYIHDYETISHNWDENIVLKKDKEWKLTENFSLDKFNLNLKYLNGNDHIIVNNKLSFYIFYKILGIRSKFTLIPAPGSLGLHNLRILPRTNKKICFLGELGSHKGLEVIEQIVNYYKDSNKFDFYLLGKGLAAKNLTVIDVNQNNVIEKLMQLSPDIIVLPNQIEETWSYVLSEAMGTGAKLVLSDIWVFKERVLSILNSYPSNICLVKKDGDLNNWIEGIENEQDLFSLKNFCQDSELENLDLQHSLKIEEVLS